MSVLQAYKVGEEVWRQGPMRVVRAEDLNNDYFIKIFDSTGVPKRYIDKFEIDLSFHQGCRDAHIPQVVEVLRESHFTYIVYEQPSGGNLQSLIDENGDTFSESFVRHLATSMLKALSFLHLNDIVHGSCLPINVFFPLNSALPGWLEHIQLSTVFCGVTADDNDASFDLKDLAYLLCFLMKRNVKVFERIDFSPVVLKGSKWQHLGPDFVDFIEQLWVTDKSPEDFLDHHWMLTIEPLALLEGVTEIEEEAEGEPFVSKGSWLQFKLNVPKSIAGGGRKWVRAFGSVTSATVALSGDESGLTGPEGFPLPLAWNLQHVEVVVTLVKYGLTFALQNRLSRQVIVWLRFEESSSHDEFKSAITDVTDPGKVKRLVRKIEPKKKPRRPPKRQIIHGAKPEESEEQRNQRMSALLSAQSKAYARKTQTRKEASLETRQKVGSLAPFPSDIRTRIHPGHKWDKRSREVKYCYYCSNAWVLTIA